MKLYKTTATYESYESGATRNVSWQGTQADARSARKDAKENGSKDVETEEVDVPTSKPELLEWLNENVTGE